MHQRLRRHGITAEPGRQTPLLSLAADLLGIHIQTAIRWADDTAPDWASYLDARSSTPAQPQGPEI